MRRVLWLICVIPLFLSAQFAKVGISGMKFLNIPVDPRGQALAEAIVAVTDDASSVFWNPAGIARFKGNGVFAAHISYWAETSLDGLSLVLDLGLSGKLAMFYSGFNGGEWEATDDQYPMGNNEFVSYTAYQFGVGYGRFLTDKFAFGATIRYLKEDYPTDDPLNDHDASSIAMDIGGFYQTAFRSLRLGLVIQNFGPDITPAGTYFDWASYEVLDSTKEFRSYYLPLTFRGGLAMELIESDVYKLTGAVDLIHPNDNVERYSIGFELNIYNTVYMRTGYQFGRDDGIFSWNAGLGIAQNLGIGGFRFDYSYSYGNLMPSIHRVALVLEL